MGKGGGGGRKGGGGGGTCKVTTSANVERGSRGQIKYTKDFLKVSRFY